LATATTEPVSTVRYSQPVDNRIGTITFWHKAGGYGFITMDTTPAQKFFVHVTNFPDKQRPFVEQGKTVEFSSKGRQIIGEGKCPRASKAKLLQD
jgi:cold shock CspA family protein